MGERWDDGCAKTKMMKTRVLITTPPPLAEGKAWETRREAGKGVQMR